MDSQLVHSQIVDGALAALHSPPSDADLRTLALICGPQMLLDALNLIDRRLVVRITPPCGRPLYQVAASSSGAVAPGGNYTVYPDLGDGYCPCAFFSSSILTRSTRGETVPLCKHLLACRLADRLDAWHDKSVGLAWIAALATHFGAAPSETAVRKAASAPTGSTAAKA